MKSTRQTRKTAESPDESKADSRRKSTRVSSKPTLYDASKGDPAMVLTERRKPIKERATTEEKKSTEKTVSEKKKLLMSPRTALAEDIEALSLSSRRPKSTASENLKMKLAQQKTPEKKKARTPSPSNSTPEKKSRRDHSQTSEDSSETEPEPEAEQQTSSESTSGALKGRSTEFESLMTWILESKSNKSSLSIYISGQPGTGKTATTSRVLKALGSSVRSCIVNCASTNTKTALFKTIFESLDLDGKSNVETFEEHVKHFKTPLVLVLDEIDHLATRKNAALYAAFQWPDTLSHKIIILGIANSIDLTERLLPKLMLVKPPKRLIFEPYTKDDIVAILNDKMKNEEAAVDAKAIELTARKVAAMSGDLRTALHIFKQQKSRLLPSDPEAPPSTPMNGCREVLGIINSVYSSPLARARLPLQPRILLAVSLALSSNKKCTFDRNSLLRAYYKACEAIRVPALDDDDLHSAFQTLESQSFIRQINGGKLVLQVDAPTAKSAISDNAMFDQIALVRF